MDLGKTALGNWKAQQGGCTHIQVGPSYTDARPSSAHISRLGRIPPPCSSSTTSVTSSEFLPIFDFFFFVARKNLLTHWGGFSFLLPPFPLFFFPRHVPHFEKVHELWDGILQTLPPTKPPHGGARCPRVNTHNHAGPPPHPRRRRHRWSERSLICPRSTNLGSQYSLSVTIIIYIHIYIYLVFLENMTLVASARTASPTELVPRERQPFSQLIFSLNSG